MRTATLVGLAAIPVGFLWHHLFGPDSAGVIVAVGVLVGVLYSGRPTPAHRAGARAGLFAPIPVAVVQVVSDTVDLWATSASLELKVVVTALFGSLVFLFLWVFGALLCIVTAAATAWIVDRSRPYLPHTADTVGR